MPHVLPRLGACVLAAVLGLSCTVRADKNGVAASAAAPLPAELSYVPRAAAGAPNILFLLAEDIGPELGCYPESWASKLVRTPNIDRLAREGVRYTRCFTTAPVCSTSRSAIMTGMYQTSIGAHQHRTWQWNKRPLPPGVFTLCDYFRAAGYYTCNVNRGRPRDPRTGERLPTGGNGSGKTDFNFLSPRPFFDGDDWNERAPGQPFFAQLSIQESHKGDGWPLSRRSPDRVPHLVDPDLVPVPPYYPDDPIVRDELANYLDAIMLVDSYVGDILARLEREHLLDNTIIVFIGDNGQCLARGKQFLYDGGTLVPLLIRWPDRQRGGEVDPRFVSGIDLSAALLGLAGIKPLPVMQGRDFLAPDAVPRPYVFTARDRMDTSVDRMRAVRTERWKYIRNYFPAIPYQQSNAYKEKNYPTWNLLKKLARTGGLTPAQAQFAADHKPIEELYDLANDPDEVVNLAGDPAHFGTLHELRALIDQWVVETGDQGGVMEDPLDIYRGYNRHLPDEPAKPAATDKVKAETKDN